MLLAANLILSSKAHMLTALCGSAALVYGLGVSDGSFLSRACNWVVLLAVLAVDRDDPNTHSIFIAFSSLYL